MNALILKKTIIQDDSLLLRTLTENGKIQKFKIPGILKSKKRSGYFLMPGTNFKFTLSGSNKEISIPKELELVNNPYSDDVTFEDLNTLSDLLCLFKFVMDGSINKELYDCINEILLEWKNSAPGKKEVAQNTFYLYFLKISGFLDIAKNCSVCSSSFDSHAIYILGEGLICSNCIERDISWKKTSIDQLWVNNYFFDFTGGYSEFLSKTKNLSDIELEESKSNRKKILEFFENF